MNIITCLKNLCQVAIKNSFNEEVSIDNIPINDTKTEFEGEYTIVTFGLSKILRKKPDEIAQQLGEAMELNKEIKSFNVIKGFLNLSLDDALFNDYLIKNYKDLPTAKHNGKKIMVEFSSPNTNKPLHFGHLRNNFLGDAVSQIYSAIGYDVCKANLINDRGIHICKSMLAWQKFGKEATPENTNQKGDHLVGEYYVKFNTEQKKQEKTLLSNSKKIYLFTIKQLKISTRYQDIEIKIQQIKHIVAFTYSKLLESKFNSNIQNKNEYISVFKNENNVSVFKNDTHRFTFELLKHLAPNKEIKTKNRLKILNSICNKLEGYLPLFQEAQEMLRKWEANDEETVALWKKMNQWVYNGFDTTYAALGISFDRMYYESETYLLGKAQVDEGLAQGVFFKKEDGSVWINLEKDGLDEKLVLRADGTSVYITQDIGTAQLKYEQEKMEKSVYVIADEQNYHMKVLKLILEKLNKPYAKGVHHLSYGMVELPSGRMKSREGTVVDADDMIAEMIGIAQKNTEELGKVDGFDEAALKTLYSTIGLGALKFYLLRVDPKKKMIFNPEESIDFHGFTGPFVQYTHARLSSILRKASEFELIETTALNEDERNLLLNLEKYQNTLQQAAEEYNPSLVCNYVFGLAKTMNSFLANHNILNAESDAIKKTRLAIAKLTKATIAHALNVLGINAPERM